MIVKEYDFSKHTFQDQIHGAITLGPIERAIIDHKLFQRLHGLRQNALLYLIFPSANHTRFDHSLGVMHLAGRFLDAVINNQEKICEAGSSRTQYQPSWRVDDNGIKASIKLLKHELYYRICLRAAALLHDIGHGPLSHLFDEFFPTIKEVANFETSPEFQHIRAYLAKEKRVRRKIKHEVLSCIIATRILGDISATLSAYGIKPSWMAQDVCGIIERSITPSGYFKRTPYRIASLLHDIISSDLDADRMDYLLRDSQMCGVNYGLYDPDRILKSMSAYSQTKTKELRVAVRYSGIGALEDLMLSRYQMHSQIYGHKTNRACDAMLQAIHDRLKESRWKWYEGVTTTNGLLQRFVGFDDKAFIETLMDKKTDRDEGKVKEIAEKLFTERQLYKRVYEERAGTTSLIKSAQKRWERYQRKLTGAGIPFRKNVFKNQSPQISSRNYSLKVLRKDPRGGWYMVHNLNTFCSVARYLPRIEYTYRVYCKSKYVRRAKALLN